MYEPQEQEQKGGLPRLLMVISDCRDIRALLQKEGLFSPRDHGYGSLCCHLMPWFPYFLSRVDISGPFKACACGATSISAVRHPNIVSAFGSTRQG